LIKIKSPLLLTLPAIKGLLTYFLDCFCQQLCNFQTLQLSNFVLSTVIHHARMSIKPITHLIYDLDGLLLDIELIHAQVNQAIAARYGKVFNTAVHTKIIGRTAQDSAQVIIDMLGLPLTVAGYLQQRDAIIYDLYPFAPPMPGAVQLTQHFYRQGIPQAIATRSTQKTFHHKTLHHQNWLCLFDCLVLADDPLIRRQKPAPDCFLAVAERLGADPEQCLVFEDSLVGITAAKRAGMKAIAVPAPCVDQSLFYEADEILGSLEEFQPQRWQLPPLVAEVKVI
jgi:beta-phosphoglucomutase-like phosphatase (HAD superfamily)